MQREQQNAQSVSRNEVAVVKNNKLSKFRRNSPPQFQGSYDLEGAKLKIQKLQKIFEAIHCRDDRMVTYATFMMVGDVEFGGEEPCNF